MFEKLLTGLQTALRKAELSFRGVFKSKLTLIHESEDVAPCVTAGFACAGFWADPSADLDNMLVGTEFSRPCVLYSTEIAGFRTDSAVAKKRGAPRIPY